ncbi:DNA-binding response regulator [Geothermobacter hydrogeniphilus]|uniref:DNA-binding response regulator n=1 Tax=Geothermobacter hydrogeniphilus TaxID=1969733 RepID=A0A2K2H9S6_9BACT|nr:response regulator transcription factor [Geothermobacter hydrogeniphilus]PNU20011.1 DNA-binding response regulator [Geothermobacter hydrogeniphilus]
MAKLKILVADDHSVVREGIRRLLESEADIEVVAEAEDGLDALEKQSRHQPDLVILDLKMPRLNGTEVTRQLCATSNPPRVLILSGFYCEDSLRAVLDAGARGYLLKGGGAKDLLPAVRAVAAGRYFFSRQLQFDVVGAYLDKSFRAEKSSGIQQLSDRERQVFLLIVEGYNTGRIAEMLSISPKTAEKHRASIIRKLGVNTPVDMVRYAIRHGVIQAESWGRRQA